MSNSIARRRPIDVPRLDRFDAAEDDDELEMPTRVNTIPPEVVEEMMRDAELVDAVNRESEPPSLSGMRLVDPSIERDVRDTCVDLPELHGADDVDSIDVEMFEQNTLLASKEGIERALVLQIEQALAREKPVVTTSSHEVSVVRAAASVAPKANIEPVVVAKRPGRAAAWLVAGALLFIWTSAAATIAVFTGVLH
jgi:hypothetical protein